MDRLINRFLHDGGRQAARYAVVSVAGIVVTQLTLLAGQTVLGLTPVPANTLACSVAAVPVFALHRAWVWELGGRASLRREVLPFWMLTLVGLVISTAAVALVATVTSNAAVVAATNIGAYGALWVAKFLVLDDLVFGHAPPSVPAVIERPTTAEFELVAA